MERNLKLVLYNPRGFGAHVSQVTASIPDSKLLFRQTSISNVCEWQWSGAWGPAVEWRKRKRNPLAKLIVMGLSFGILLSFFVPLSQCNLGHVPIFRMSIVCTHSKKTQFLNISNLYLSVKTKLMLNTTGFYKTKIQINVCIAASFQSLPKYFCCSPDLQV